MSNMITTEVFIPEIWGKTPPPKDYPSFDSESNPPRMAVTLPVCPGVSC